MPVRPRTVTELLYNWNIQCINFDTGVYKQKSYKLQVFSIDYRQNYNL